MKNKMNTEQMYATMKPWRLFFIVAIPGMISMFAMSVYSIIEGAFIGQRLGEGAFAAINIAMPMVMMNFLLADLVGVGASVPISIALGKKDAQTANNVFTCSIILIFITSALMGAVMFFAAEPLSRMMGADDVLLDTSVRYMRTFAVCSPLCSVFFAMDNYLKISGFVKTSMVINICSNIVTIVLLVLFLVVFEMDVVGSALACCISMCTCSIVAILPFAMKKTLLRFTRPKFSLSMLKQIGACGSPVFLSNVSGRITSIVMNISLMTLGVKYLGVGGGTTAVAVYAVLMYSSDLCWPLLYGISDSLAPAIGYNWGAQDYKRVKSIAKCNYIGTAVVGLISTAAMFLLAPVLASLFANANDTRLLTMSAHAIRLFCFAYLFRWFATATQNVMSAIEKPIYATAMSVAIAFVFPLTSLAMLWGLGLDGIWLNFALTTALTALLGVILMIPIMREIKRREMCVKEISTEEECEK